MKPVPVAGVWAWLVVQRPHNESYNAGDDEDSLVDSTDLIDLRGKTSLIQLAGACKRAKAVVSVDAGPLHIAAAVGAPTLGIVGNDLKGIGASPARLWMPRCDNFDRTISTVTCSQCADNRFVMTIVGRGHPVWMPSDHQK